MYLCGFRDGLIQSSGSLLDIGLQLSVELVGGRVLVPDWLALHWTQIQQLGASLVHLVDVGLVLSNQLTHLLRRR